MLLSVNMYIPQTNSEERKLIIKHHVILKEILKLLR